MKNKILITGVAGFIGSNLARTLLEHDYPVAGIDNLSAGTLENIPQNVEFHQLDIRNHDIQRIFEGVDVVFHLAAKNCLVDCQMQPVETSQFNVEGTVNVLEATRMAKVRQFIYADTSAEYEGIRVFPSPEDKVDPQGIYAVSKRSAGLFCDSYYKNFGLNVTTVWYFNVYGPSQDWRRVVPPVMSSFIIKLLNGENPVIYGNGNKRRDFIYVDDVNRLHLALIGRTDLAGRTFNVGSGVNYSIKEIYDLIEGQLQTGMAPIYGDDLPGEAEQTLAEISQAERILGWSPQIDIKAGIQYSIQFIQQKVLMV